MIFANKQEKHRYYNNLPAAIERRRKIAATPEAKARARELRNSTERRELERERQRKRHYGMRPGEWDRMFMAQGSKCAICSTEEHGGKHWHTDHCHRTGRVRGVVCHNCNHMLGGAKDRISNLLSAVEYLRMHASV